MVSGRWSNGMRNVMRGTAFTACVFVLLGVNAPAAAEEDPIDEIEYRLKTAGVPDHLRTQIRASIQRGVEYLLERQGRTGSIRTSRKAKAAEDLVAGTTIAGLALAHSGGADARRGADLAIDWLIDEKAGTRRAAMTQTYHIGLLGMLLKARDRHPKVAEQIVRQIALGQGGQTAWWGYRVGRTEEGTQSGMTGAPNLSTSQFAALGLWAAARVAKRTSRATWRAHLESLLRSQTKDGSWPYAPRGGSGYPNGTSMGLANLLLCRGALEQELPYDPLLRARLEVARRRGMSELNNAARQVLAGGKRFMSLSSYYYSMYAMEKACVFADVDDLRGLRWYVRGAKQLIALQHEDGGWGKGADGAGRDAFRPRGSTNVLNTSFALLFLLRTSEVYRPTTPRDVPRPAAAVTGKGASHRSPARGVDADEPEPPEHVTVSRATELADRLVRLVKEGESKTRHLVQAVDEAGHALTALVPDKDRDAPTDQQRAADEMAMDAVRDRLERTLITTYKSFDGPAEGAAEKVAVAAATQLAHGRPEAVARFRKYVVQKLHGTRSGFPSMARLIAALRSIARAGDDDRVKWLAGLVGTEMTPRTVRRSRAALVALSSVRGAAADPRFYATRSLVKQMQKLEERAALPGEDTAALAASYHFEALSAPALLAVTTLARDPTTGDDPALASGLPPMSFSEFLAWFGENGKRGVPPWQDAD